MKDDKTPPPARAVMAAAVYVDTSSLRRLPVDLSHPDLARFNDMTDRLGIEAFIPAVVRDEWIVAHQLIARKKRQDLIAAARAVENYLGEGPVRAEVPSVEMLDQEVERVQLDRLRAAGFVEIPTPAADVNELLHLAVRLGKPFGDEDRGFRDAMIARTITAHAVQFPRQEILVISYDDVFGHPEVIAQWKAVGAIPTVVRDFSEGAACLEAGLDEAVREYLDDLVATIKAFLQGRMEQIFARLRNVEVSEGFIKGSGLSGLAQGMAYYGTLERVRGVRPLEIGNVSLGHVLGGHVKRDGHRRPITFFVKVAFDITVREFPTASLFGDNNLKIRLDVVDLAVPAQGLFGQAPAEAVSRDMAVEREIIVEAWIHEDAQTDAPVDLEIDKINAW